MSWSTKGKGVTRLSELAIDADKDWQHKRILNLEARIESAPPTGGCKVENIFVDPVSDKLMVEYEDVPI